MLNKKYVFETQSTESTKVSSNLNIKTVSNHEDLRIFYRVPWQVYNNDSLWVPPLWSELSAFFSNSNPFWNHTSAQLFIAYHHDIPVGRIVTFIDSFYPETTEKKVGFFGFFECINNQDIALVLLEKAETWLQKQGMKQMRGPIDGRVDVGCGFQYHGFDIPPAVLVAHTPPYYCEFAEAFHMRKARDQLVYHIDLTEPIPDPVIHAKTVCEEKGFSLRSFRRFRIKEEMKWWLPLMKETFASHWCYVDVPDEEILSRFGIKQLFWTVDPGLFLVAEYEGTPIAFKWSLPDYNQLFKRFNGKLGPWQLLQFYLLQKTISQGKFNFVGIQEKYRGQGVGTFMNYYTLKEMKRRGYASASCGWIDEKNIASIKTIEKAGAQLSQKFRVYEKSFK